MKESSRIITLCLLLFSISLITVTSEIGAKEKLNYYNGKWMNGPSLNVPLDYTKVIQLKDGKLLAYSPRQLDPISPQVYDPAADRWIMLNKALNIETAIALSDGQALIVDKLSSEYVFYLLSPSDLSLKELARRSNKQDDTRLMLDQIAQKYNVWNQITDISDILEPTKTSQETMREDMNELIQGSSHWKYIDAVAENSGEVIFMVRTQEVDNRKSSYSLTFSNMDEVIKPVRLHLQTKKWDLSEQPIDFKLVGSSLVQYNTLMNNEILLTQYKAGVIYNIETKQRRTMASYPTTSELQHLEFAGTLPNGDVLFAGGWKNVTKQSSDSYIYSIQNDKWSKTASLPEPKTSYANLTLPNGDIMLIGGLNNDAYEATLKTTVIYKPKERSWVKGPELLHNRNQAATALLSDGRIMTIGGISYIKEDLFTTELMYPAGLQLVQSSEAKKAAKWRADNSLLLEKILSKYKSELLKESNMKKNTKVFIDSDGSGVLFITKGQYSDSFFLKYADNKTTEIYLRVYKEGKLSETSSKITSDYLKAKGITTNNKITSLLNSPGKINNNKIVSGGHLFTISRSKAFSGSGEDSIKIIIQKR